MLYNNVKYLLFIVICQFLIDKDHCYQCAPKIKKLKNRENYTNQSGQISLLIRINTFFLFAMKEC